MIRQAALLLARSSWFRKAVLGTPVLRDLAGRFVGGDDLPAALATVRRLQSAGLKGSLNYHGMHAETAGEAQAAVDQAIQSLQAIAAEGLEAHVSVKLTKIGFDLDPAMADAGLRRILDCAASTGGFVRLDMEEAAYLDDTLWIFEAMLERYGRDTVGIVIQSYLRHRRPDLDRLMDRGARIRLVKGGYRESPDLVFRRKAEVDAAFLEDIERLLRQGLIVDELARDDLPGNPLGESGTGEFAQQVVQVPAKPAEGPAADDIEEERIGFIRHC